MHGGKKVEETWSRRTNEGLRTLYKDRDIIGVVRLEIIRQIGCGKEMKEKRLLKSIFSTDEKADQRHQSGKKEVEGDLQKLRT